MKSRYGLGIVCVCWMALAGCANWQNRMANNGPGTAATLQPVGSLGGPAVAAAPGVGPGTTFNEPPPPLPPSPSDPNATLAPLGSAPPQRLDLSGEPGMNNPAPARMYNLGGGPGNTPPDVPVSSGGSSTLSKLASKAGTSSKPSGSPTSGLSTVQRLSADASASRSMKRPEPSSERSNSDSQPKPSKIEEPEPTTAAKKDPAPSATDAPLLPVRKGADSDEDSKGPQSSVAPGETLFGKNRPVIYPVSNPVSESPVDLTQFS